MAARHPVAQQPAAAVAVAAPGAHPQYSLPELTQEEQYVQRRQAEILQKDVKTMQSLDTTTPFANLQDAVMRLLPFHVRCIAGLLRSQQQTTSLYISSDKTNSKDSLWMFEIQCKGSSCSNSTTADAFSSCELAGSLHTSLACFR